MSGSNWKTLFVVVLLAATKICAFADNPTPVPPVDNPCPRFTAGSIVQNPPDLYSHHGVLTVNFSYQTRIDEAGRTLFCFMTPAGEQNPTLHVQRGDHLVINVTNNTPETPVQMSIKPPNCGDTQMTGSSLNIHYHGTNTSPACGEDQVIQTLINSGHTFRYEVAFPTDEPPGLYWYHPHVHGLSEINVQGGASGAIIVEGIQNFQPAVAGLRQKIMLIRDQTVAGQPNPGGDVPSYDLTLNNIPVDYPAEIPAIIRMMPDEKQLWRVSNSSADSILDLQVVYDGSPQNLQIVEFDGVPAGSQDGESRGKIVPARHILLPPAGRAEFIVIGPSAKVKNASFVTQNIETGPDGDADPVRTLATIETVSDRVRVAGPNDSAVHSTVGAKWRQRFEGLATAHPTTTRRLYFSEVLADPANPTGPTNFYVTVEGATPTLFDPNNPPAITTTQGSVEEWTIQNRSLENHEFHIHQIHFLVLSQSHFKVNGTEPDASIQGQYLDTIQVPYWDGNPAHPYPSVTLRMDFRGPDIGDFVYHCHILGHEDMGMMAIVHVKPASKKKHDSDDDKPSAVSQPQHFAGVSGK